MAKAKQLSKSAYDYDCVKLTTAWALLFDGKHAGKVVAKGGPTNVCTVSVWAGPGKDWPRATGHATGYGYCKFSAAFDDALNRAGIKCPDLNGRGAGAVRCWLESLGYTVIEVL